MYVMAFQLSFDEIFKRGQTDCKNDRKYFLMNVGIIPVYPVKDSDILNYRKGLIAFYEMEDYSLYTDYFLDRQIERIKEIE